jgi:hypothetical protein
MLSLAFPRLVPSLPRSDHFITGLATVYSQGNGKCSLIPVIGGASHALRVLDIILHLPKTRLKPLRQLE